MAWAGPRHFSGWPGIYTRAESMSKATDPNPLRAFISEGVRSCDASIRSLEFKRGLARSELSKLEAELTRIHAVRAALADEVGRRGGLDEMTHLIGVTAPRCSLM